MADASPQSYHASYHTLSVGIVPPSQSPGIQCIYAPNRTAGNHDAGTPVPEPSDSCTQRDGTGIRNSTTSSSAAYLEKQALGRNLARSGFSALVSTRYQFPAVGSHRGRWMFTAKQVSPLGTLWSRANRALLPADQQKERRAATSSTEYDAVRQTPYLGRWSRSADAWRVRDPRQRSGNPFPLVRCMPGREGVKSVHHRSRVNFSRTYVVQGKKLTVAPRSFRPGGSNIDGIARFLVLGRELSGGHPEDLTRS